MLLRFPTLDAPPLGALVTVAMAALFTVGCASDFGEEDDADQEPATSEEALTLDGFEEPTDEDARAALERHPDVDTDRVIPRELLGRALAFAYKNHDRVENQRYISVIDFSRHSSKKRFFILDMRSGQVESHVVAHGSGSDPSNTGYATRFSNKNGSNASSLGYYLTGEPYAGRNGRSLRLDGVSDTNSNARARAVVIHGASYVEPGRSKQGRSWGCPAVSHSVRNSIIERLKGKSVLYIAKADE